MTKKLLHKEFIKFEKPFDFNNLALFINNNNFSSKISSNWIQNYVCNSVFQIKNVEGDPKFHPLIKILDDTFNTKKLPSDLDIFFSYNTGASSITHKDEYDVYILNMCGITLYKIEDETFELYPGDLLYIPEHVTHTAIGLTPRIILSYGIHTETTPNQ